jgi:hypothetical protein
MFSIGRSIPIRSQQPHWKSEGLIPRQGPEMASTLSATLFDFDNVESYL